MITTGAISISNMMMVNHSLQELYMWNNSIGDDGISAIARELARLMNWVLINVTLLLLGQDYWQQPYHPIQLLYLRGNPITVEGAQLIVEAAVHNTVCLHVGIDEYKNDKVKEMLTILEDRERQEMRCNKKDKMFP